MNYLEGLNDRQREAVLDTEGPLLILAGAGSGKTRVVTSKIAYLIQEKNINPWNILAITFTNKAAEEMKERVAVLLDRSVDGMWMGTFHSICVRILRKYIEEIGYNRSFTIYDRDDQITLVRECINELNINKDNYKESAVLSYIGTLKDNMTDPDKFINTNYSDYFKRNIGEIYSLYQKKLKEYNALDFDDLLIKTVELLSKNEEILREYQDKFQYVFVDEYQDTNRIQYKLIRQLSGKHKNLSVVGDADQSIYGWRGADISNILDFEKDYKNAKTILLEENYRSSSNILELANEVIKNNSGRKEKNLWTSNKEGHPIKYIELQDERSEAKFVVEKIDKLLEKGFKLSDFAILYRTNAQSRSFEEAFMSRAIPYKLVGGLKFYDRKEIKDIVGYLRVLENPVDNISLKRIINTPRRGIGAATLERLEDYADKTNSSIFNALVHLDDIELSGRARNSLQSFKDIIDHLLVRKDHMSLQEFIEEVINYSGYLEELKKEDNIESKTRIENIQEFVSVAMDFEVHNEEATLENFLADVALLSEVDKTSDTTNVVTMMTVHGSKGLEFPVVFMVGMEDGLFPSIRPDDTDKDMEEERRLCYVAITRAEKKLFLTNTKIRTIYGRPNYAIPSRFIKEMGDKIEKVEDDSSKATIKFTDYRTKGEVKNNRKSSPTAFDLISQPKAKVKVDNKRMDIALGNKVEHSKWGVGTVVQLKERDDGDKELTIAFETEGLKKLLKSIAPIKVIG